MPWKLLFRNVPSLRWHGGSRHLKELQIYCTLLVLLWIAAVGECTGCAFDSGTHVGNTFCNALWETSGGDFRWTRKGGLQGTPSSSTGPTGGPNGAAYVFLESSSPNYSRKTAYLTSAVGPWSGVSFKYHMYGSDIGSLTVQVQVSGSWVDAWDRTGQQHASGGAAWSSADVPFTGPAAERVRFVGVTGSSYRGDAALTDVQLVAASQAPAYTLYADTQSCQNDRRIAQQSGVATLEACGTSCAAHPECTYFTYFSGLQACRLHRGTCPRAGLWVPGTQPAATYEMAATCTDSRHNGDETGLDCGGSCPGCGPEVQRWVLGATGSQCDVVCASECDPDWRVTSHTSLLGLINSLLASEGVAPCVEDPRPWWAPEQPGYVHDPLDVNYRKCVGTTHAPASVGCFGANDSVRRLCQCRGCSEVGVDYSGSDVASASASSAHECQLHCARDAQCNFYTFAHDGSNRCWLKGSVSGRAPQALRTSGPKACGHWTHAADHHCGGVNVDPLEDGTVYGHTPGAGGAEACKALCAASPSCTAFVWRVSDSACLWKTGATAATMSPAAGHNCHLYTGTCWGGEGQSARLLQESDANNYDACHLQCQRHTHCAGFDYTATAVPNACRLFGPNGPSLGNGGPDRRRYCERAAAPQVVRATGGCSNWNDIPDSAKETLSDRTYTEASCDAACHQRRWCTHFFLWNGTCIPIVDGCTPHAQPDPWAYYKRSAPGPPASCDDGVQNGAEAELDCGGRCRSCACQARRGLRVAGIAAAAFQFLNGEYLPVGEHNGAPVYEGPEAVRPSLSPAWSHGGHYPPAGQRVVLWKGSSVWQVRWDGGAVDATILQGGGGQA